MTNLPVTQAASRTVYSATRAGHGFIFHWLRVGTADPNPIMIAAVCLIGLLVTLNLIFGFPKLRLSIEQLTQIFG